MESDKKFEELKCQLIKERQGKDNIKKLLEGILLKVKDENQKLRAEVEQLRETLRIFTVPYISLPEFIQDDNLFSHFFHVGDIRRARAVLEGKQSYPALYVRQKK